jgi:hypothetical protein
MGVEFQDPCIGLVTWRRERYDLVYLPSFVPAKEKVDLGQAAPE